MLKKNSKVNNERKLFANKKPNSLLIPQFFSNVAHVMRVVVLGLAVSQGSAFAASIEVTSTADDDTDCTLREAIISINDFTQEKKKSSMN